MLTSRALALVALTCLATCNNRPPRQVGESSNEAPSASPSGGSASDSPRRLRVALALGGGGYRAMLASTGALQAIEDLGLSDDLVILSCVSGSCLAAATYSHAFTTGDFSMESVAARIEEMAANLELGRTLLAAEAAVAGDSVKDCLASHLINLEASVSGCAGLGFRRAAATSFNDTIASLAGKSTLGGQFGAALVRIAEDEASENIMLSSLDRLRAAPRTNLDASPGLVFPAMIARGLGLVDKAGACSNLQVAADSQPSVAAKRGPLLVVNATDSQDGGLWSASGRGICRVSHEGAEAEWSDFGSAHAAPTVAEAVAASACHPAVCRPIPMASGNGGQLRLIDGGIYDNLGVHGLRAQAAHLGMVIDLLVVLDARRLMPDREPETSRVGTILRIHEYMLHQLTERTLSEVRSALTGPAAEVVELRALGSQSPLAALPTDLKPIEGARALIREARDLVRAALCKRADLRPQIRDRQCN